MRRGHKIVQKWLLICPIINPCQINAHFRPCIRFLDNFLTISPSKARKTPALPVVTNAVFPAVFQTRTFIRADAKLLFISAFAIKDAFSLILIEFEPGIANARA